MDELNPPPEAHQWITTKCAWCPAEIIWATTEKGRAMPVDAERVPRRGNVELKHVEYMTTPLARVLNVQQQFGRTWLRTSHMMTCPKAAQVRAAAAAKRNRGDR